MKIFLIISFLFCQYSSFCQQKMNLDTDEIYFKSVQYLNLNEVQLMIKEVREVTGSLEIDSLVNENYYIYISKKLFSSYDTRVGPNYTICLIDSHEQLIKGFFIESFWEYGVKKHKITNFIQEDSDLFKKYIAKIFHLYKNHQTNEIELKQIAYKDLTHIVSSFEMFINKQKNSEKIFIFDLHTKMEFNGNLKESPFYQSLEEQLGR